MLLAFTISAANAQDEGFIYGKILTVDGNTYQGPMRWGKEEVYWTDMFNASKDRNDNLKYLSRDEREYLEEQKSDNWGDSWGSWNVKWDWSDDYVHQFGVQFGEIKKIKPFSRNEVDVELQNGDVIEVNGDGYNDIGSDIKILDEEIGEISVKWTRIEEIEFMATPKRLEKKFGEPLYGVVETEIGEFTGYIQWDHDERISTDKLDGDTYDGDVSIEFGKIKSIERYGSSRSKVELKSGRELELRGSNDVNSENRGVIITVEDLGRIDVEWSEFEKVTFIDNKGSGKEYDSFKKQTKLTGKVMTTEGTTHTGAIIFDLDESFDYEVLNGEIDDNEHIIPFRNISSITPKNYNYSKVVLKNGEELVLGDSQDVSDDNEGVVVLTGDDPVYIPWEKIEKISFN